MRALTRVIAVLALLLAAAASAQEPVASLAAFDLERLSLNPSGQGSLLVGSGALLPKGELRLSFVGHYERNPLALYRDGRTLAPFVQDRVTAHLMGAYAPLPWLEVDVHLPVVAFQRGADLTDEGIPVPASFGLGTPEVTGRFAALEQRYGAGLDLGAELTVGLPFGSAAGFSRDQGLRLAPRVMAGRRFGFLRVGGEVGVLLRPAVTLSPQATQVNDQIGSELRLAATVGPAYTGRRLRWEVDVLGSVPLTHAPGAVEVLGGVRLPVNLSKKAPPVVEVFALAGLGMGAAPGTPLFRVLVGGAFGSVLPARTPTDPPLNCEEGLDYDPRECPDLDRDGDGVKNQDDRCPVEAGTKDLLGCPNKDTDGDGIPDILDRCPGVAGLAARQGCPIMDQDGDSVEDQLDACPDKFGPPENRGCPLKPSEVPRPDADKDGLPDDEDNCPRVEGPADNEGCPLEARQLVRITGEKLALKAYAARENVKILFDPVQKAKLDNASFPLLEQVSGIVRSHPGMRLLIEVHSDNRGDPAANLKLTQVRAEAVRRYLVESGVAPERLEARGVGEAGPVDSNDTAEGRENNRRVELLLLKQAAAEPPRE